MVRVTLETAEHNLRQLVERAAKGDEVLITGPTDKPLAKIVPARAAAGPRQAGTARGRVWMSDDFDAPLDDFREYMP
jgi:antitoxin (DNA-binding transcriptional repressor) of toxin-antitoxin stability system